MIKSVLSFALFLSIVTQAISEKYDSTYIKEIKKIESFIKKENVKANNQLNTIIENIGDQEGIYFSELSTAYRMKASTYKRINPDSITYFQEISRQIALRHKDWPNYLKSTGNLASSYGNEGQFELSDSLFNLMFNHEHFDNGPENKIKGLLMYSQMLNLWEKKTKYFETLREALDISNSTNFHKFDKIINNILGKNYGEQKDYEQSIFHFKKNVELLSEEDPHIYATLNNIGSSFLSLNQLDSAKTYLNKVINGSPRETSLVHTYQNLASVYEKEKDYEKSLEYSDKCIELSKKYKRWTSECSCKFYKGTVLHKQGKIQASQVILTKISSCQENLKNYHSDQYKEIVFANKLKLSGLPELSDEWHDILSKRDSIKTNQAANQFRELETKYQTEKKEAENQLLKKDNDLAQAQIAQQRSILTGAGVTLLSLGLLLWNLIARSNERKKNIAALTEKNEAIQALNQEIGHRTKNHLALATALLSKDKVNSSDPKVISALGENENRLRTLTLVNQKLNNTSELENLNLKEYIQELCDDLMFSLEKSRAASLQLNCEDIELDSEKVLRLGLITNELITNSFKHSKNESGLLNITLNIASKGKALNFNYTDNGTAASGSNISQSSQGMGLMANLWQQLRAPYEQSFSPHYNLTGTVTLD